MNSSESNYDVVIVGGGPAGVAAAYDLAVAGLDVLILDKAEFPRFKACAGGLTTKALLRLRYSVAPVIKEISSDMEISLNLHRKTLLKAPDTICALTVRTELDEYCFNKAMEQGASFRRIKGLKEINEYADAVQLVDAEQNVYNCSFLIGADGAHSQVRKIQAAFKPDRTAIAIEGIVPMDRCSYHPPLTFDFGVVRQGYGWLFPKGDHVNVGVYTRRPEEATINKDILRQYSMDRLGAAEVDHMVGFPIGTGGEYYHPSSQRVFLVGDAAGMAEALLGEGLHNAIKSGQVAAAAILATSSGAVTSRDYFDEYLDIVRGDVSNCRQVAKAFYKTLPISFGVLKYGVSGTLMKGYASGMTLTECKRAFLSRSPVFERRELQSLLEFRQQQA